MKINRSGQAEPLTRKQFQAVTEIITDPVKLVLAFSWYTVERPGAILQLVQDNVWDDRDRLRKEILFPANSRKDRKLRLCPVHKNLRVAIERYDRPDSKYVFPAPTDPTKPLGFSTYSKALYKAFDRLGMVGYTPYSARRGALTLLMKNGVHPRHIQAISGHSSLNSLQRYLDVAGVDIAAGINLL